MVKKANETAEALEPTDDSLELHKETIKTATNDFAGIDFVPDTWEQVVEAMGGDVIEFEGSPYKVVDKDTLVGVPFMIVDIRFSWSEKFDSPFCNVLALTKDNERVVINDGSTGIMEQMKHHLQKTKRKSGIICEGGLRKSEYTTEVYDAFKDETKEIQATTYYIA